MRTLYRIAACAAAMFVGGLVSSADADHRHGYSGPRRGGLSSGYYNGAGSYSSTARYGGYSAFPGNRYYNSYSFQYEYGGGFRAPYVGTPLYNGYRPAGMHYGYVNPTVRYHNATTPRIRSRSGFRGVYSRRYYGR